MVLLATARRPFGRMRLPVRAKPITFSNTRQLSTSPIRQEILGITRRDLRDEKAERPRWRPRPQIMRPVGHEAPVRIKVYPPIPSAKARCKEPLKTFHQQQIAQLDPTGARQRLFSKTNLECARVGDILLVRQRNGDPFSGVCINIRRRGVDTAILLRNQLTRVGVEMWFKIFSPNVEGIEVVQRRVKRARRARLYYMRHEKHDRGSVENIVAAYLRQRSALSSGDAKGRGAGANKRKHGKSK